MWHSVGRLGITLATGLIASLAGIAESAPVPITGAQARLDSPGFAEGLGFATNSGTTDAFIDTVGGTTAAGFAQAHAGFGVLQARAEAIDPPGSPSWKTLAAGVAFYTDIFTFMGGVIHTPGSFNLLTRVSGAGRAFDDGGVDAGSWLVQVTKNPSNFYGVSDQLTQVIRPNPGLFGIFLPDSAIVVTTVHFTYGDPIELQTLFQAAARTDTGLDIPGKEEHSFMDYFGTALSSFVLQDGDSMIAQSGTQYRLGDFAQVPTDPGPDPTPGVPLPGTLSLLALGVAGLWARRWIRSPN